MNTKMKVLALALLGLVGYAGSAAAGCPASLVPPWTAQLTGAGTGGTATSQPGGLEATPSPCALVASFDATANGFSFVGVIDGTPANEVTYRFRFYVDPTGLGTLSGFDSVQAFSANSAAAFDGFQNIIRIGLVGGTTIAVAAADNSNAAGSFITVGTAPLSSAIHWVEGQVIVGSPGTVKLWIDATAESDTPAITLAPDNTGWVGVDLAALGLATPQGGPSQTPAGRTLKLDAFDSRRTTFIGQ
jgi:hypothetical protein